MKKRPNRQKRSEPVPSSGESGAINGAILVLALLGAFLAGQAINNTGSTDTAAPKSKPPPSPVRSRKEKKDKTSARYNPDGSMVIEPVAEGTDGHGDQYEKYVRAGIPPVKEPWNLGVPSGRSVNNGNHAEGTLYFAENMWGYPDTCPKMIQPKDVHFYVINLEQSKNRLKVMQAQFNKLGLPMFERSPGIIPEEKKMEAHGYWPRRRARIPRSDYGVLLAHVAAWKKLLDSEHEWAVILEDDAVLMEDIDLTSFPPIPEDADAVLLRPSTIFRWQPTCKESELMRATWGFGLVGYLVSKAGAQRLLDSMKNGINAPVDVHIFYKSTVYTFQSDRVTHADCGNPCEDSVRMWIQGALPKGTEFPDRAIDV